MEFAATLFGIILWLLFLGILLGETNDRVESDASSRANRDTRFPDDTNKQLHDNHVWQYLYHKHTGKNWHE